MSKSNIKKFMGELAKLQKKYDVCIFEKHTNDDGEDTITNGEWLFMTNPEKLLDTACGFDCALCACADDCTNHREYCTSKCMAFKTNWLSSEHVIPKCKKKAFPSKKPVRCIETGVVYDSMVDAEKATGVSHKNISEVCRRNGITAGGLHWEFA